VELLNELCLKAGFSCCCIYGTLDPAARKIALARFRARKAMVMIVTDVAARGIDVPLRDAASKESARPLEGHDGAPPRGLPP